MGNWSKISSSKEFKELERSKALFVWPITILFILYYLSLPLLAGYAKPLMNTYVVGSVTFGYLYAVAQFFVAWILAFVYVGRARRFDESANKLHDEFK
ncbi:conserved hypothetical protein [[Clostridium] ultunense Esp]|uniref:DUF485 domain-containing protein n=1 Tax=Thermicanus aegyptius TaxID=94009 RepID=UPI0002B6FB97|nr:DUF485 domain-containing protein [Thermicanus aegyptius]CCQ94217.1 conserved hypothetical protein [[Clostridium] ultunense Esp]